MDIRRLIVIKDTVHSEGGLPAVEPVTRVAACAVIGNPLADQASDQIDTLIPWGAELGERLVKECLAVLPVPVGNSYSCILMVQPTQDGHGQG
jgi:Amino acid synthesis